MSTTLEKLSPLLSQQYNELPWNSHISTNNFSLEIDNVAITVSVAMERIKNHVPKTEIVFTGKAFRDTVSVDINPSNMQVRQTVENHFRSQVKPNPWNNSQNETVFDLVKIDGQRI